MTHGTHDWAFPPRPSMMGRMGAVLGVDISSGAWAGVLLDAGKVRSLIADDIASLVGAAAADHPLCAVAIDIPIDPPTQQVRRCDEVARAVLKGRGSTLFTAPCLQALRAPDFPAALQINRQVLGRGLSQQAYRLAAKILDVHGWLADGPSVPAFECHPELSFAVLADPRSPTPVRYRKTSWEGARRRTQLLAGAGIAVAELHDPTGRIGCDDMLDAAVAAWTARRFRDGQARRFPADAAAGEPVIWA